MSELKPTPMAHRVFDKQTGEYLQPQQHRADGKGALFIQEHVTRESFHGPFIDEIWTPAEPDRYTVERWTGRHDRNASAIYAGDKALIDGREMFVYDAGSSFVFTDLDPKGRPKGDLILFSHLWTHNLKVIGTIHDRSAEHG